MLNFEHIMHMFSRCFRKIEGGLHFKLMISTVAGYKQLAKRNSAIST